MAKKYYLPPNDEDKASLFDHVKETLPAYTATLAVDPDDVTQQAADALYFR